MKLSSLLMIAFACSLLAASSGSSQVVIDMPPPPKKKAPTPPAPPASQASAPSQRAAKAPPADEPITVGDVALYRYGRVRRGTHNTYFVGDRYRYRSYRIEGPCFGWPYWGYSPYWWGSWPWYHVQYKSAGDAESGASSASGGS